MALGKKVRIRVNGDTVTDYCRGYTLEQTFAENTDVVKIKFFKKISNEVTPDDFQIMEIWEGYETATDKKRFKGFILDVKEALQEYEVTAYSMEHRATIRNITRHYKITGSQGGKISEIFKDLLNEANLPYDDTSIQDSGSSVLLKNFICKGTDIRERLDALAERLNWQWYYDADTDLVYFEQKGFKKNDNTIYIGGDRNSIVDKVKWKKDAQSIVNQIDVKGAYDSVTEPPQYESGDGTTANFTLNYIPASIQVFVDDSEQTIGKESVKEDVDVLLDASNRLITFQSGSIPPSGTDNIKILITRLIETPVQVNDERSIANLGEISAGSITLSDVVSVSDAEEIGKEYLKTRKNGFRSTKLKIKSNRIRDLNIDVGQIIYVEDTLFNGTSGNYLIRSAKRKYPESDLEIEIGNKEWKTSNFEYDYLLRLKRLEEKFESDDILLNVIRQLQTETQMKAELNILKENINDTFTLNHPVNGLLDQGEILDVMNTSSSDWSSSGLSLSDNSDDDYVIVQDGSLQFEWTSDDTYTISTTQSFGDMSEYTGTSSGTPTKGTLGTWLYVDDDGDISSVKIKFGSDDSNYIEIDAKEAGSAETYGDEFFDLRNGWNYLIFHFLDGSVTGTPDWTNVSFAEYEITTNVSEGTSYLDYFTISKSNYIGLNGLGKRYTTFQEIEIPAGEINKFPLTFGVYFEEGDEVEVYDAEYPLIYPIAY